jgi:hypothetical protein
LRNSVANHRHTVYSTCLREKGGKVAKITEIKPEELDPDDRDTPLDVEEVEEVDELGLPVAEPPLPPPPSTKIGRPRDDGFPIGSRPVKDNGKSPDPALQVPNPKFQRYYSDHANAAQRSIKLWTWVKELPTWAQEIIDVYVYRDYPPLLDPPEGSNEYKYIDKLPASELFSKDEEINDKYGAGDFHLFLNVGEQRPHKRTLATAYVKGSRSFRDLPPCDKRITEMGVDGFPKWIDRNDPQCKVYVEYLRTRGIIPELHQVKKEQDAMAEAAQTNKLIDKVIEMAEGNRNKSPALESDTIKQVIDASLSGARASTEMLKDTVKTLQEQITAGKSNNGGGDLTAVLGIALDIADKISKANDPAPYLQIINKLNETVMGMKMEMLDAKIEQLKTQPAPVAQSINPVQSGVSSLKATIEDFRAIKDLFGDLGGEAAEDAVAAKMPWWGSLVSTALPVVEKVGLGLLQAYLMSQTRPGAVTASQPQSQPQQPFPMQQPPNAVQMQPASLPSPSPAPTFTNGAGNGTGTATGTTPPPITMPDPQAMLIRLIDLIQVPLTNYIIDNQGGDDFADWFIGGFGEEMYADVIKYTAPVLTMGLYSYPPIAARLAQTPRETVEKFINDFCSFNGEDWDRKKRQETEREMKEPTPIA